MRLVSLATLAFLVLQVGAAVAKTNASWPVAGFPMFREKRVSFVNPGIALTFADGRTVDIKPADLDITTHQYRTYLLAEVVDTKGVVHDGYEQHVQAAAKAYASTHGHDQARTASLYEDVFPFPAGTAPTRRPVAQVALP